MLSQADWPPLGCLSVSSLYPYALQVKGGASIGVANYKSHVCLNGELVGEHEGGFTPVNFEITDRVRPQGNDLIVRVDNKRLRDGVPTLQTDWWNYGGLTRRVRVIEVAETHIRTYHVQLARESADDHVEERWTEEYQEYLYRRQIGMLRQLPFLAGISPWILVDFRSPRRPLPEIQDFWNRKGLISNEGDKKRAFFVLQSFYEALEGED